MAYECLAISLSVRLSVYLFIQQETYQIAQRLWSWKKLVQLNKNINFIAFQKQILSSSLEDL